MPVLDVAERASLLLDRLEQVEHVESKISQARLVLDAVDDFLKGQANDGVPKGFGHGGGTQSRAIS